MDNYTQNSALFLSVNPISGESFSLPSSTILLLLLVSTSTEIRPQVFQLRCDSFPLESIQRVDFNLIAVPSLQGTSSSLATLLVGLRGHCCVCEGDEEPP